VEKWLGGLGGREVGGWVGGWAQGARGEKWGMIQQWTHNASINTVGAVLQAERAYAAGALLLRKQG